MAKLSNVDQRYFQLLNYYEIYELASKQIAGPVKMYITKLVTQLKKLESIINVLFMFVLTTPPLLSS